MKNRNNYFKTIEEIPIVKIPNLKEHIKNSKHRGSSRMIPHSDNTSLKGEKRLPVKVYKKGEI